ncbi:MAG: Fpg/Nei family DNA glycosylase [Tomitella sp.]|nr:Fpg/Nei family DNA glycosylase [Tomitella sp.]
MPELPEVEVVRRGLASHVLGLIVTDARVLSARTSRRFEAGSSALAGELVGRVIVDVARRGKYLWLELDPAEPGDGAADRAARVALVVHLGMSGQMLVRTDPAPAAGRHLRAYLHLEPADGAPSSGDSARAGDAGTELAVDLDNASVTGRASVTGAVVAAAEVPAASDATAYAEEPLRERTRVEFVDQRTFGWWLPAPLIDVDGTAVPLPVAHIARDPMDSRFDTAAVVRRMRAKHTEIKRLLLDQTIISGVGNIYADEALWRARVHGGRAADALTRPTLARVVESAREVMAEALDQGGTSFDALYVDVNGESGYFSRALNVYGRDERPCPRCGAPIRREKFMNRSSYSCPRCQVRPRHPLR